MRETKKRGCKKSSPKSNQRRKSRRLRSLVFCSRSKIRILKEKSKTQQDLGPACFFDSGYSAPIFFYLCNLGGSMLLIVVLIEVKSDGDQRKLENDGFYAPSLHSFV